MQTSRASKPNREPKPKKRMTGGILLALVVLLTAGGWGIWQQKTEQAMIQSNSGSELLQDFGEIWSWSDPVFQAGAKAGQWSFRLDGQWSRGQAEWMASAMGVELSSGSDGVTYSGTRTNAGSGYELKIWYTPTAVSAAIGDSRTNNNASVSSVLSDDKSTEQVQAVLLLQFEPGIDQEAIGDAVDEVEKAATAEKLRFQGGFAVRGTPKSADSGLEDEIVRKADALRREVYDDGHTRSITYSSPKLHAGVNSGGVRVNLQIAKVKGDAEAQPEIVIGVPLITGDYRTSN